MSKISKEIRAMRNQVNVDEELLAELKAMRGGLASLEEKMEQILDILERAKRFQWPKQ